VKQGVVLRSACTTTTGVALPNLMTNLKTIYAKTEPFRFLKPMECPVSLQNIQVQGLEFEATNADLRALGILLLPT